VTVLQQVHARTDSGRTWSVMEGVEATIDDDDAEMINLIDVLDARGLVRIELPDLAPLDADADPDEETKQADVQPSAATKPAATKPAATKPSTARSTGRK